MNKRTILIAASLLAILSSIVIFSNVQRARSVNNDKNEESAIKAKITEAYTVLATVGQTGNIQLLESVFVNTNDYEFSSAEVENFRTALGALMPEDPGYLTALQAKYLAIDGQGAVYTNPNNTTFEFVDIAIQGNRAIVLYDDGAAEQEAILVKINGIWYISAIKAIKIHF